MIKVSTATPNPYTREYELEGLGKSTEYVYFKSETPLATLTDNALPAFLPIAMGSANDLAIDTSLSPDAIQNANAAQEILTSWYPGLSKSRVSSIGEVAPAKSSRGVGCFFSGGVDSFYSVICNLDEITDLIFVIGFDIDIANEPLAENALSSLRLAADALGKNLLVVRTNIRSVSDKYSDWGTQYHGAGLASIAHLFSDRLHKVIVPSSYQTNELFPWASHPELDGYWGNNSLEILHDSTKPTRAQKIERISTNPLALDHLRVCWKNTDANLNCGECEKCIRTMIVLQVFGKLESCKTLPNAINPRNLRKVRSAHSDATFAKANLELMHANNVDAPELEKGLRTIIRRAPYWDFLRKIGVMKLASRVRNWILR